MAATMDSTAPVEETAEHTAETEVKAPSSTTREVKVRTVKVKGVETTLATCRVCDLEQTADADHWFRCKPDSKSGKAIDRELGLYVSSRCRSCEKAARANLDPNREIIRRGSNRPKRETVTIEATPDLMRDYGASRPGSQLRAVDINDITVVEDPPAAPAKKRSRSRKAGA